METTQEDINAAERAFADGIGVRITDPNEFAIMACNGLSFLSSFWDEDNKCWVAFLTHEDRPQIIFVNNDLMAKLYADLLIQNKSRKHKSAFLYDEAGDLM
jgi:hypothetical protein